MSDSETGRIQLRSQQPGVEFTVRNADLLMIASAIGRIDVQVSPGLYRIEERAGTAERAEVVAVRAGSTYRRTDVVLPFPCIAPVTASSRSLPGLAQAVERASEEACRRDDPNALLIVARAGARDGTQLFDAAGQAVPAGSANADDSVTTRRLAGGGYVLRTKADRALWLTDGWQTIAFLDEFDGFSVHMVPAGVPWRAADPAHIAVEAAASAFRRGLCILGDESINLDHLTRNPILGMFGAHALRRDAEDRVVNHLKALLPDHPDVQALAATRSGGEPVWWPPLLVASYHNLLAADAANRLALRAGSPAERIAASVVPSGPWLSWLPGEALGPIPSGQATERVRVFLAIVADFERRRLPDVIEGWDEASIAQSTGLPVRTVGLVLSALDRPAGAAPPHRSLWRLHRKAVPVERTPLTYAGAVTLLSGTDQRLARIAVWLVDDPAAGVRAGALDFFAPTSEAIELIRALLRSLPGTLIRSTGPRRLELIAAAHTVLVLSALLDAVDDQLGTHAHQFELTAQEKRRLTPTGDLADFGQIALAMPSSTVGFEANLRDRLRPLIHEVAEAFTAFLSGRSAWELVGSPPAEFTERVEERWRRLYRERYLRLAEDVPELAEWATPVELGTTADLDNVRRWLEATHGPPSAGRMPVSAAAARLTEIARNALNESLLGWLHPADELTSPTVGEGWIEPMFRCSLFRPGSAIAGESWWRAYQPREHLGSFLIAYLTSPVAAQRPMIVTGDPGAGKSTLAKVIAGRLAQDSWFVFLVRARNIDPALPMRRQLEGAAEALLGEPHSWDHLIGQSKLRVVIVVDGLDEAIGHGGADLSHYLLRMQQFQVEQADRGVSVAVLVTARTAFLDRIGIPDGSPLVRLEEFDETRIGRWVLAWNVVNALRPLTATALRYDDLASNPLLLSLLAIRHATEPAAIGSVLSAAALYGDLLDAFIGRRLRSGPGSSDFDEYRRRLAVAAFGMFNRSAQHLSHNELWDDLAALGPLEHPADRMPADTFDDFFFVRSEEGNHEPWRRYEFLHATFAEFLVAEHTLNLIRQEGWQLRALLSHEPLLSRRPIAVFFQQITKELAPADLRASISSVDGMLARARTIPDTLLRAYAPRELDVVQMTACYTANLITLRLLLSGGTAALRDLAPLGNDPVEWWRSTVRLWRSGLEPSGWALVVTGFTIGFARPGEDLHVNLADFDNDQYSDVALDLAEVSLLALDPVDDPMLPAADQDDLDAIKGAGDLRRRRDRIDFYTELVGDRILANVLAEDPTKATETVQLMFSLEQQKRNKAIQAMHMIIEGGHLQIGDLDPAITAVVSQFTSLVSQINSRVTGPPQIGATTDGTAKPQITGAPAPEDVGK